MHCGVEQDDRLSPALAADHFRPDELTLARRLAMSLLWARQIRFVDTTGHSRGSWSELLESDPSFLLAELACLPVSRWLDELRLFGSWPLERQRQHVLQRAAELDGWYRRLLSLDGPALRPLSQLLGSRLGRVLGASLQRLEAGRPALTEWHPDWFPDLPADREVTEPLQPREIRLFWLSLCRLLDNVRTMAARLLPDSLGTGVHDPSIGLLLAWTRLLVHSRAPMDRFHERLTAYYYGQRLGMPRLPSRPAAVHLLLVPQPLLDRPVQISAGRRFLATEDGNSRSFAAQHGLWLSPLRVAHLLTLAQQHDRSISPERDYGYASRTAAWRSPVPSPDETHDPAWRDHPPLGGGRESREARQGLIIASPLLALQEGEREIHIGLHLARPSPLGEGCSVSAFEQLAALEAAEGWQPASVAPSAAQWQSLLDWLRRDCPSVLNSPWLAYLLARCLFCTDRHSLPDWLGRLLAIWLCASPDSLETDSLRVLRRHVRSVVPDASVDALRVDVDDPLALLYSEAELERSLIFDRVFRGAWSARLSTATGWLELPEVFAMHGAEASTAAGLHLMLRLRPDHPAIVAAAAAVHGGEWPARPVLELQLCSRSRLFASSLLQQLPLEQVSLRVEVRGLRSVQLHNQLGRLDAGKPFQPFGPLPDASSYLVFGHPELTSKALQQVRVHLQWNGLPPQSWADHYDGYADSPWHPADLRVTPALLVNGQWLGETAPGLPLFDAGSTARSAARPAATQVLDLGGESTLLRLHRPADVASAEAEFGLSSRQGFFRLQLSGSPHAFGHTLYPRLMSERLVANSRLKVPLPLPNPPYTPTLGSMRLDYVASAVIAARPEGLAEEGSAGELMYLTPFGVHPLRRIAQSRPIHVLQRWPSRGQLLIGLQGPAGVSPSGPLSLMLQMRAQAAAEPLDHQPPDLRWQVWCADDWVTLDPVRVLVDGTEGLLHSGVIVLDLPAGMTPDGPGLPAGCFWIRLLGDGDLGLLAGLLGVWTNGLLARQCEAGVQQGDDETPDPGSPLQPRSIQAAEDAVPGLAAVLQPWPSFGGQLRQQDAGWMTRTAERLRHRGRASTPWDFERLVLDAFDSVGKVRCIGRSELDPQAALTLVVVPRLPAGQDVEGSEAPRLDAATLAAIRRFVFERMAPCTPLLVRNAAYERIQVRCSLRLLAAEVPGERLRQLNAAVRDFLSPWREGGLTGRFDWQLRAEEIEALLRGQPGVDSVGPVSLLHIASDDDGHHRLTDTARGQRLIRPGQPWSLALPTRTHLLELSEQPEPLAAVSGLSRLTLGSSFIIGSQSA
jgi:hypothetical protein